jgi:hypothetical protein
MENLHVNEKLEGIAKLDEIDYCLTQVKSLADCLFHATVTDSDIDYITISNIASYIRESIHKLIKHKDFGFPWFKDDHIDEIAKKLHVSVETLRTYIEQSKNKNKE